LNVPIDIDLQAARQQGTAVAHAGLPRLKLIASRPALSMRSRMTQTTSNGASSFRHHRLRLKNLCCASALELRSGAWLQKNKATDCFGFISGEGTKKDPPPLVSDASLRDELGVEVAVHRVSALLEAVTGMPRRRTVFPAGRARNC
jgi:hypothetical protein